MRNKRLADVILVLLLIGFIMVTLVRIFISNNFIVKLISFMIEAALVGGIADWFAVTALFRRPLGFSWHTAIIPRNKEKVVDAIASVVQNELLSSDTIEKKIDQLNITDIIIPRIEKSNIKVGLSDLLSKYGHELINKFDTEKIAEEIEALLKTKLKDSDLKVHISNILDWAVKNDMYDSILESLISELIRIVETDKARHAIGNALNSEVQSSIKATTGIKRMLLEISLGVAEETNSVNISEAAASIQKEVIEILSASKDRENELYFRLKDIFKGVTDKIRTDESLQRSIEAWKQDVIMQVHLKDELKRLLDEAKNDPASNAKLIQWIVEQVDTYWRNFKQNDKSKAWVNNTIKDILNKIIKSEHHLLGRVVKDTLNSFTDEALNEFIESKAGNDLHWIRINGSIVGAVAGLVIYLFINLFYDPVIVPIIKDWILHII